MGVDTDLTSIVGDIVQFLESLGDIDLPLKIENARESLLQRTKTRLAMATGSRGSASPEPYLDMNAGKGLLQRNIKGKDIEIEEYVGVEDRSTGAPPAHQDYYESFNEFGLPTVGKIGRTTSFDRDERVEEKLREIYRTFTRADTAGKAIKSGNLERKFDRKPFGFGRGNVRPCWIGLVGSHLIMYGNNDDKQPPEIYPIRGYKGRAAPNAVPKDPERAKSAFEIFCPGNKTLQFIARTPKEMKEWIDAIGAASMDVREGDAVIDEELIEAKRSDEPGSLDVGISSASQNLVESVLPKSTQPERGTGSQASVSGCVKKNDSTALSGHSPPALPIRLQPRRLPSLPNERVVNQSSYEPMDDGYEEDDIYHKIDDFRANGPSYENVKEKSGKSASKKARAKKSSKRKKSKDQPKESHVVDESPSIGLVIETYDDVQTIIRNGQTPPPGDVLKSVEKVPISKAESCPTYDDVAQTDSQIVVELSKSKVDRNSIVKSPHKRWFILDRVIHRKDSPKKEDKVRLEEKKTTKTLEKKEKAKCSLDTTAPTSGGLDSQTYYDDVSEAVNRQKIDDLSNYNCPPPPRPVYIKSSNPVDVAKTSNNEEKEPVTLVEQVYDDISNYRDNRKEESREDGEAGPTDCNSTAASRVSAMFEKESLHKPAVENESTMDSEHYQTPRKNFHHLNSCVVAEGASVCDGHQEEQQLYDDIAILADFRARQRDPVGSTGEKLSISPKRPWNRFGSGKKIVTRDIAALETVKRDISKSYPEDVSEPHSILSGAEKHDASKLNKLQKFYNKVESTLGKQPAGKSINPLLNKTRKSE